MASPDSDLDGSPELGAVVSRLYHWYGMGPFSRGELAAAILTIARPDRDAPGLDAYVRLFIAGLERCRYVASAEADGFVLSESSAAYARRRAETLEREIEILGVDLDALFREEGPGGDEERKVIAPRGSPARPPCRHAGLSRGRSHRGAASNGARRWNSLGVRTPGAPPDERGRRALLDHAGPRGSGLRSVLGAFVYVSQVVAPPVS